MCKFLGTLFLGVIILNLSHQISAKRPPDREAVKAKKVKVHSSDSEVIEDASLVLEIQHSVGKGNEFYPRGTLHLKSLKSSPNALNFQQLPLPQANITSLRMAAEYGDYYFIRARSKFTDLLSEREGDQNDNEGRYVVTFISACALVNSKLSDVITINGDGQGNVIGLTLSAPSVAMKTVCEDAHEVRLPSHFNSSLSVDNGLPGPTPNSQGFFQKIEKEEKDKKEGKDDRSFLQKYWLYLVIGFVVFSLVNSAAAGGGGGG